MFKKIRVTMDNLIHILQLICDDVKKIRVELQAITYAVEELKQQRHESILPEGKNASERQVIDQAFRLRNGLYSFKKAKGLIKDGE